MWNQSHRVGRTKFFGTTSTRFKPSSREPGVFLLCQVSHIDPSPKNLPKKKCHEFDKIVNTPNARITLKIHHGCKRCCAFWRYGCCSEAFRPGT